MSDVRASVVQGRADDDQDDTPNKRRAPGR